MKRIMIVGATGMVGGLALQRALNDDRIEEVIAPTRRQLPSHPKLTNPLTDFAALPQDADWWAVDGVACALGTTRAVAGSAAAFRAVDLELPLTVARITRRRGSVRFALTSSMGADPRSPFLYTRTKGELEAGLRRLSYPSLTIVRPGLLGGERSEPRAAEAIAQTILGALAPILPRHWRISAASKVADALVDGAVSAAPGVHVVGAAELA